MLQRMHRAPEEPERSSKGGKKMEGRSGEKWKKKRQQRVSSSFFLFITWIIQSLVFQMVSFDRLPF